MMQQKLSVFGLGKLGFSMLVSFASKGWKIIGVDSSVSVVERVQNGQSPIYEPDVEEMLVRYRENITAVNDPDYAVQNSAVSFIIVPTPSVEDGSFTIEYVQNAVRKIAAALQKKQEYHLVVITSTVLPGDMIKIQAELENLSGKKCGKDFGLCYNPDFIALGSVVRNFMNPDMILIGESDPRAGEILENIHLNLCNNNPPVHRMNFFNAELSKISLNSFCTMKITFANMIGQICENMPGGDASAVLSAVGDDKRVGQAYFKAGLSFGGPCFPRDNRALASAASRYGVEALVPQSVDIMNLRLKKEYFPRKVLDLLAGITTPTVAVLGVSYKKGTNVVEESAVVDVINSLIEKGVTVKLYDPAAMENAAKICNKSLVCAKSAADAITGSDIVLIGTNWDEFRTLNEDDFLRAMNRVPVIVDPWNMFQFSSNIEYYGTGKAK